MTVTHQSYTKAMERRKAQWLLKYAKDIKGQSLPRFPWGFPFQNRSRPPTLGSCGILRDPAGLGHLEVSKIMTSCYAVVDGLIT